jgi:hypothetical protein
MELSERTFDMMYRTFALSLTALAVALLTSVTAPVGLTQQVGDGKSAESGNVHQGTVVRVTADKLIMKGEAKIGQEAVEHTHTLADTAKVTCDTKACKLEDLKAGQKIRVTTKVGDRTMATRIEALDRNVAFERRTDEKIERNDVKKDPQ